MLDLNWQTWCADGTIIRTGCRCSASTPPFDHCNFTVLESFPADRAEEWTNVLFRMRYDNPAHREMMDLEGLKAWLPGRTTGYAALTHAVRESGFFGPATS